jgi:DNA helicase HerA-like ATPase
MKNDGQADSRFLMGHLIGTEIPLFLDPSILCEGHLAILGMTRMGKSTLAMRLAKFLSQTRSVVVMDQTGEYRTKQQVDPYNSAQHDSVASLSVFEPAAGKAVPDEGLSHLKGIVNKGYAEYKLGPPFPRVLLIDEAHQFVPEPALLGFGAPGRESAITFGMYAMQVRKYGVTLAMISQRTAVVAKTALSQCENVIAFKSVDQTGLEYLEAVLGPQTRDVLPTLQQGEALVCGPAFSSDYPVAIAVQK